MKIQNVADISFRKYGKVLEGFDFGELLRAMKHTPIPKDVIYLPTVEELEILPIAGELQNRAYGGMPIQVGFLFQRNILNTGQKTMCSVLIIHWDCF